MGITCLPDTSRRAQRKCAVLRIDPMSARSRSRSPERNEDDGTKRRRNRFSDGPSGFSDAGPQGIDTQAALQQAMLMAAAKAAAFAGGGLLAGLGQTQRGPPPGEQPPPPGKVMGSVKNFNLEKGFGFIIPDDGGDDIFAHGNSLQDGNALREGSRVCYRSDYDASKGKARAEEVTGAYTDPSRPPPRMSGGGGGMGAGMGGGGYGGAPQRGPLPGEQPPPPGKQMGVAKRWNNEKGFGFIIPDDGTDDIFVHAM